MAMKLDAALKLYIALYVLCFGLTFLISVPMLIHVSPQSECLLFVSAYIRYGNPAGCQVVGLLPILVALAALILIVLHAMQLRSLYAFLDGMSADHERPPHIFWRIVVFHGLVTCLVLVVTAISTAGYAETCQNLYREVRTKVRSRVTTDLWGGGKGTNELYDKFANDHSIERYTNQYRDYYGESLAERSITCRNVLTDPENHSQLKQAHATNPYYRHHFGAYFQEQSTMGNIVYYAYRDNTILELCLAGSWISLVVWIAMLVLMLVERHHLKAHLTDESVFGSEFGSASRRSASRYSNHSGSGYSSRLSKNPRSPPNRPPSSVNGSILGSVRSGSSKPAGGSVGGRRAAANTSVTSPATNGSTPGQRPPFFRNQSTSGLLSYFGSSNAGANTSGQDEPVDVDEAIQQSSNDLGMERQPYDEHDQSHNNPNDTSFELPIAQDTSDGLGGPMPLGDEVSTALAGLSEPYNKVLPDDSTSPMSLPQRTHLDGSRTTTPNRVTGRRGQRSGGLNTSISSPTAADQSMDFSMQRPQQHQLHQSYTPTQHQEPRTFEVTGGTGGRRGQRMLNQPDYKTQFGTSSMI